MQKKYIFLIALVIFVVLFFIGKNQFVVTNNAGYYQVKQAAFTGTMTTRSKPGLYGKWLGDIETYDYSDVIYLSSDELDGGNGKETQACKVDFPNGSAKIDAVVMYELSLDTEKQLLLHRKYNNNSSVKSMVRQQVLEALGIASTLMSAESAYITKSEYRALSLECLTVGLYEPQITIEEKVIGGQIQKIKHFSVKKDSITGKPIIRSKAMLPEFGIKITQFNIKKMDFDDRTKKLINSRREAQQAAQAAITAKALGEERIATKKAEQEAFKIEAVTKKEKEKEVAELEAQKNKRVAELEAEQKYNVAVFRAKEAKQAANKILTEGKAQAESNRLAVAAGLTPKEAAQFALETASVVSKNLADGVAKTKWPTIMTFNGGKGSPQSPLDVLNYKAMAQIVKDFDKK